MLQRVRRCEKLALLSSRARYGRHIQRRLSSAVSMRGSDAAFETRSPGRSLSCSSRGGGAVHGRQSDVISEKQLRVCANDSYSVLPTTTGTATAAPRGSARQRLRAAALVPAAAFCFASLIFGRRGHAGRPVARAAWWHAQQRRRDGRWPCREHRGRPGCALSESGRGEIQASVLAVKENQFA